MEGGSAQVLGSKIKYPPKVKEISPFSEELMMGSDLGETPALQSQGA